MDADAQVAPVALLVADATRSTILFSLSDGRALPACELALRAGVTAATISYHVDKLIAGGLVSAERQGRHRYYRLANPAVVGRNTASMAGTISTPTSPVHRIATTRSAESSSPNPTIRITHVSRRGDIVCQSRNRSG